MAYPGVVARDKYQHILTQCKQKLETLFIFLAMFGSEEDKQITDETFAIIIDKNVLNAIVQGEDVSEHLDTILRLISKTDFQTQISAHSNLLTTNENHFLTFFTTLIQYFQFRTENKADVQPTIDKEEAKLEHDTQIKHLQQQIRSIKEKFAREEKEKRDLIEEYKKTIEIIRQKKMEQIDAIAKQADEKMVRQWKDIEYELDSVQSEEKQINAKYEHLCRENLANEKYLRETKASCEEALQEFIQFYDKHIGKKHSAYEDMLAQMYQEKQQLESLTQLFQEQKTPFEEMTDEKALWREKELAKKLSKLRSMLARNTISKFLGHYIRTLREHNIPIVITKKTKAKRKKQTNLK